MIYFFVFEIGFLREYLNIQLIFTIFNSCFEENEDSIMMVKHVRQAALTRSKGSSDSGPYFIEVLFQPQFSGILQVVHW